MADGKRIMIPVLLSPDEIEYVLMILVGMENLHRNDRSKHLREILGSALREVSREDFVMKAGE